MNDTLPVKYPRYIVYSSKFETDKNVYVWEYTGQIVNVDQGGSYKHAWQYTEGKIYSKAYMERFFRFNVSHSQLTTLPLDNRYTYHEFHNEKDLKEFLFLELL